jgi:hypothetical protein
MSGDALHDHNAPVPSAPNAAPDSGIGSIKSVAYEAIFFMKWEFIKLNKKNQEQDALNLCRNKTS